LPAFDQFERFAVLLLAGAGMVLAGGLNLLLRRSPTMVRVAMALLPCGGVLAAGWLLRDNWRFVGVVAVLMGAGVGTCLLLGSAWLARVGRSFAALAVRQPVRWGMLAAIGLATAIGSVVVYDTEESFALDQTMNDLEVLTGRPDCVTIGTATSTDKGGRVDVLKAKAPRPADIYKEAERRVIQSVPAPDQVVRRQPADERTNCHGWVFTGGRYWVSGGSVDQILTDNSYEPVTDPRPGDLVVYRKGDEVRHTALVRYVTEGMPVLVEGKWGVGGVYRHTVENSIYGLEFTYYRSPRAGHVIAGADAPEVVLATE
jgi:hypothetical protein